MFKRLKNADFSKKLLVFIEVLVLMCFCLTLAAVLMGDASALTALITGVFTLASLAFGFYFWKAKNENIRKYAKNVKEEDIKKIVAIYKSMSGGDEHDHPV